MNRLVSGIVLLLAASALSYGQSPGVKSDDSVKRQLIQLENEWMTTLDVEKARRLMVDDWVGISAQGEVWDKAKVLAEWNTGRPYDTEEVSEIRVRLYDKAAVITGLLTSKDKGKDGYGSITIIKHFTHAWVKNKAGWQIASSHYSLAHIIMPQQSQ